jgi:hypothetical protein
MVFENHDWEGDVGADILNGRASNGFITFWSLSAMVSNHND